MYVKTGVEGSEDLDDWFNIRELTVLEEVKAAKAEAKKAKAAAKSKSANKATPKAKAPAKSKAKAKPKAKPKATEGNVASLASLE